ncbi:hypothetical protein [Notoacmeibacter marinus]|nr:hypothetical protein [Notoacmeibacter marinus]
MPDLLLELRSEEIPAPPEARSRIAVRTDKKRAACGLMEYAHA